MARTVGIGIQDFETVIENDCFYVDKTKFIKEWWESNDSVTLIARPRRFGKTLTMSMLEKFFSVKYAGRGGLFENLSIWQEKSPSGDYKYRKLQGTYPVISLSFANLKENNFQSAKEKICQLFTDLYIQNYFLRDSDVLTDKDRDYFDRISVDMRDSDATMALNKLSDFMCRYYGKKVILLLDEYDTPMQEAYVNGYWNELVSFIRSMFNAAFKTNPWLERGIMTGITRVSKESIFSDLNNLEVVTTTSDKYADIFGFTESEVFAAMDEMGLTDKEGVKYWYDGFTFGTTSDIYNPWSVLNYLDKRKLITSNRESGFGRYDVVLEPNRKDDGAAAGDPIIIEFKVFNPKRDGTLEDTVLAAKKQIEEKGYAKELMAGGAAEEHIRSYGFAFEGKMVLIG